MPSIESRYFPVVNIIIGTVASVLLASLVTTNLGSWWPYLLFFLATLGASSLLRDVWSALHQWRLTRSCREAYVKVTPIFKPETLDPQSPGNHDFMKEDAQRAVDDATVLMDRLGLGHPDNINVDDNASVANWYKHLRLLRRQEY